MFLDLNLFFTFITKNTVTYIALLKVAAWCKWNIEFENEKLIGYLNIKIYITNFNNYY